MTSNIINKEIDVVHLRSESDLVLETNTQIKLSTNNILINYVPFDEYIRKVVFDTAIVSSGISSVIHNTWTGDVDEPDNTKIDLTTNTSELIVDEIHTSGIFSTHSHINNNVHFINLSTATNVQLLNLSNSSNIIYNHQGTAYSLSNYIYKVINTPVSHTPVTLSPDTAPPSDTRTGIDTLGTYIGNKILTNKLTTTDVTIGGSEPILELNSATAINFMTDVYSTEGDVNAGSNILFGSLSLDSLVKSQLDENGAITIGAAMSSGQDIGMELTLLSHNNGYTFEYDVVFNLYEDDDVGGTVVSTIPTRITLPAFLPLDLGYFTGLSAGNFYTVLGTFTNTRTGTIVENIEVTGGQNIATIRNVVINSVVVKNENTITITFVPHNTYVADWSSSEKKIKFLVSINGYTGEVDTGITQDMSQSTPDQSTKTYDLSLSSIPSYGNSGILRVDETSKKTDSHYINVISNHFEVSTFEMSQTLELTPFTFSAPTNAPSLNINYGSKQLTWTHTNNSIDDKLSTITFELQKDSAIIQNNTNTYYSIQTDSIGIWKVRAKNVYEQSSADSNTITIISPSFNIGTISPNGNRTFNIGISNVNANGTYKLEDNSLYGKLPTTGFGTHTSISTNILTVGTHAFQIKLTDQLGLYATQTSNTFYINNPSVSFTTSSFIHVSGSSLRFYFTVSVSYVNGLWNITGTPHISGGSSISITGNKVYVTFAASDTGGNKSTSVSIKDSYGYTASLTADINLSVSFTGGSTLSTSVSVSGTTITFTSGLTTYRWYQNGSPISGATSSSFTMTASHFGSIYCIATQTNTQGFTRSITSDTTTNTQPTISGGSFTGINLLANPIYQFSRTLGSNTTEVSVVMSPASFNGAGIYTLTGTYQNEYGLQKIITIDTFTATAPTTPSITSATGVSYDYMTINYSLGNNGNPSVTPTITLFYGISSGSEDNSLSLSSGSTSINVSNLLVGTIYYFKIEKVYQYYGTISSSNFDETTLDYQYDSEELLEMILPNGGLLGRLDDEHNIQLVHAETNLTNDGLPSIRLSKIGNVSPYVYQQINPTMRVYDYGIDFRLPQYQISLEKANGNNTFYILFDGKYLSAHNSQQYSLTLVTTPDTYCEFVIEPWKGSIYSVKDAYPVDDYFAKSSSTYYKLGDYNDRMYRIYYQSFSIRPKNINYSTKPLYYRTTTLNYADRYMYADSPYDFNYINLYNDDYYYHWFFFMLKEGTTEELHDVELENIRFPLNNLGKINMIFNNVYLYIGVESGITHVLTSFNNYANIPNNTEVNIGPVNLADIITFYRDNIQGFTHKFLFFIKNIYEYRDENMVPLWQKLWGSNITNDDSSYKIVITIKKPQNVVTTEDSIFFNPGWTPPYEYSYLYTIDDMLDVNPFVKIEVKHNSNIIFTAKTNNYADIVYNYTREKYRYNDYIKYRDWVIMERELQDKYDYLF